MDGANSSVLDWTDIPATRRVSNISLDFFETIYQLEGFNRYFFQKVGVVSTAVSNPAWGFQVGGEDNQNLIWILEFNNNKLKLTTQSVVSFSYHKNYWKVGTPGEPQIVARSLAVAVGQYYR